MSELLLKVNGANQLVDLEELLNSTFETNADENAVAPGLTKLCPGVYEFEVKTADFVALGDDLKAVFKLELEVKDCISRKDAGDVTEFIGSEVNDLLWGHNIELKRWMLQIAYIFRVMGVKCGDRKPREAKDDLVGKRFVVEVTVNGKGFANFEWAGAKGVKAAL